MLPSASCTSVWMRDKPMFCCFFFFVVFWLMFSFFWMHSMAETRKGREGSRRRQREKCECVCVVRERVYTQGSSSASVYVWAVCIPRCVLGTLNSTATRHCVIRPVRSHSFFTNLRNSGYCGQLLPSYCVITVLKFNVGRTVQCSLTSLGKKVSREKSTQLIIVTMTKLKYRRVTCSR